MKYTLILAAALAVLLIAALSVQPAAPTRAQAFTPLPYTRTPTRTGTVSPPATTQLPYTRTPTAQPPTRTATTAPPVPTATPVATVTSADTAGAAMPFLSVWVEVTTDAGEPVTSFEFVVPDLPPGNYWLDFAITNN